MLAVLISLTMRVGHPIPAVSASMLMPVHTQMRMSVFVLLHDNFAQSRPTPKDLNVN